MANQAFKIVLSHENKQYTWKNYHSSFSALNEFVKTTWIINEFELEYDEDGDRMIIEDNEDLIDAVENAQKQSANMLIIHISTDEIPFEFNRFNDNSTDCVENFICQCTRRIVFAMKYYQTLDVTNEIDKQNLINFYDTIYPHILDDFTHLITEHPEKLDSMYDFAINKMGLSECTVQNCLYQQRHNRNRDDEKEVQEEEDRDFTFKRDTMDGVHCYTLHQYDFGFAIHPNQKEAFSEDEIKDPDEEADISCRDSRFAHIVKIIKEVKRKLGEFARMKNNNKFDFDSDRTKEEKDIEYMEGMYGCIENRFDRESFEQFLIKEEYDSEAVLQDIRQDKKSNIFMFLKNKRHFQNIEEYVRICDVSSASFSTGFIFYYWEYYRDRKLDYEEDFRNINDHSGYKKHELFVEPKHANLKCEVLNNNICTLRIYDYKMSLRKAEAYKDLKHTKKIAAADRNKDLHYGIVKGTPITEQHLLAVILYTDWSDLSKRFSMTFRKSKAYKPLATVKEQNTQYAHWSKLLREAVQCYGQSGEGVYNEDLDDFLDKLTGPFFNGMSFAMPIPAFNIRLCGPISTSVHIEVALRFGGDDGIVLQFNNNGDWTSKSLRAFNCAWISNYNGEAETLFMGGDARLRLETINSIPTTKNYAPFSEPLFYFDCMVNGTWMENEFAENAKHITSEHFLILQNLIKHRLTTIKFRNRYPYYINKCFWMFCQKKTQIVINLEEIYRNFNMLQSLIIDSETNLFKPILYDLFRKARRFIYYTTNIDGKKEHKLPWKQLLQLIKSPSAPNNLQIVINATSVYNRHIGNDNSKVKTWLTEEYSSSVQSKFLGCQCLMKSKIVDEQKRDKLIIAKCDY